MVGGGTEPLLCTLQQTPLIQRVRNAPTARPSHRSTRTDLHLRGLVDTSSGTALRPGVDLPLRISGLRPSTFALRMQPATHANGGSPNDGESGMPDSRAVALESAGVHRNHISTEPEASSPFIP